MLARRQYLIVALVAFLAALLGVGLGRNVMPSHAPVENELHRLLHDELELDKGQEVRIHQLEQLYLTRRKALEAEMRADNHELAQAIRAEHGFGPRVNAAVDKSHHAMGALQKETLRHVFAMRNELRPDQARRFEEAVIAALTVPAQ
jgi:hypothetical protein